jgi:hypothetical protein
LTAHKKRNLLPGIRRASGAARGPQQLASFLNNILTEKIVKRKSGKYYPFTAALRIS